MVKILTKSLVYIFEYHIISKIWFQQQTQMLTFSLTNNYFFDNSVFRLCIYLHIFQIVTVYKFIKSTKHTKI